jgi:hypothetical protein
MLAMHIILVSLIIERISSTLAKLIQRVDRPKLEINTVFPTSQKCKSLLPLGEIAFLSKLSRI